MMMVSFRSRPICDKSCESLATSPVIQQGCAYLDIVALMIITTFTEQSVVHYTMDVELIEEGIAVLNKLATSRASVSK